MLQRPPPSSNDNGALPPYTLPCIFVISIILAFASPSSDGEKEGEEPFPSSYKPLHDFLGWVYFLAWSLSFYPQLLLNVSRRTTVGLSSDYALYNLLGFTFYSIYTLSLAYNQPIRDCYRANNGGHSPAVSTQDVFFAAHALAFSALGLAQIVHYDGMVGAAARQPISRTCFIVSSCLCSFATFYLALILMTGGGVEKPEQPEKASYRYFDYFDYIYALSYCKVFITLIKYVPQFLSNRRRRSTTGWNVWNVILDITGGAFSVTQLLADCASLGDWTGLKSDLSKFFLGAFSIMFDVAFLFQHYVLYGYREEADSDLDSSGQPNRRHSSSDPSSFLKYTNLPQGDSGGTLA